MNTMPKLFAGAQIVLLGVLGAGCFLDYSSVNPVTSPAEVDAKSYVGSWQLVARGNETTLGGRLEISEKDTKTLTATYTETGRTGTVQLAVLTDGRLVASVNPDEGVDDVDLWLPLLISVSEGSDEFSVRLPDRSKLKADIQAGTLAGTVEPVDQDDESILVEANGDAFGEYFAADPTRFAASEALRFRRVP